MASYKLKETRLDLEPQSSSSVVVVALPGPDGAARNLTKRSDAAGAGAGGSPETAYRTRNLATASSIYHRRHHHGRHSAGPRSFLWRLVEDRTALSVRPIDVCRQAGSSGGSDGGGSSDEDLPTAGPTAEEADWPLTLELHFAHALVPACVALADAPDRDALDIFALDEKGYLCSLSLRADFFRRRDALELSAKDWYRYHLSSGFSFRYPHRLVADETASSVVVTLHDGGMIRFDRNKHFHSGGQQWKETHYKVTGWTQNIKSLLPFQGKHTIRYGGANMELSAATSVAETSLGLKGASFLFTVCLDHCMRVWNLKTGQVLHSGDILGVGRDPHEVGRWTIDPSQQNLIRLVDVGADGHAICATYSPVGSGAFKFWRVEAAGDGVGDAISVTDMFPNDDLTPPMPASPDVWTLTDFSVETRGIGHGGEWEIQLWTLWKNNMTYRVQRLSFPPENVASAWRSSWIAVHSEGIMPPQPAAPSGPWDAADVAEKWLQLIFGPGRFTRSTLETALAIYERSVGARTSDRESASSSRTQYPKDHRGLAEAVSAVLASAATLNRDSAGGLDYEQYRTATNTQWQRFYRLLLELDRQRGEALSLATDPVLGITWVVCADCISAIRRCSPLERLQLNPYSSRLRGKPGSLVEAGAQFVDAIPDSHLQICNAVLRPEIYEDSSQTDYERIQYFSDKTGLWRVLTDEDCQQVTKLLGNNFKDVSTGLYQETLGLIFATDGSTSRDIRYPLTEFGRRLFVKTVQDTADMHWNFCFAQLILLVHMTFEFEQEEDALHNRLDIGAVYRQLVASLRRLELVRWLLHKEISVVIPREHSGGTASPTTPKHAKADVQVISVFEASVGHLLGLTRLHGKGLLECYLTDVAIDICAPDSDTELSTALVQCSLLTRDRGDLALELSPFCEHDPFSTYVQGRVFLAVRDFESAAIHFERAAYGMSMAGRHQERHSSGLLDDVEWNMLTGGLSKYHAHIVSLYEKYRAYSYVERFAERALPFIDMPSNSGTSSNNAALRTELLSRLFTATTAQSRFDRAHAVLTSMTESDPALQRSCLRRLVEKMCESSRAAELIALPFPGMQDLVDDALLAKCAAAQVTPAALTGTGNGTPYHQILYAWRISRGDFRGAAAVILDRIQKLRLASGGGAFNGVGGEAGDRMAATATLTAPDGADVLDTPITAHYLMLINALSCVDPAQAWVFAEDYASAGEAGHGKRTVLTLADIRKQYQDELDRIAAIQNNQFGFGGEDGLGDVMIVGT